MDERLRGAEIDLRAACGGRLKTGFPLAPLTSFRLGGPAALFLEPGSDEDLHAVSDAIRKWEIPFAVLGKGSDVLVADDGFGGLVIRLGTNFRWAARDGAVITAGGAMPLPALAGVASNHGLSGFSFAVAIPASLGGAVRMNAGAHSGQMSDVVDRVELMLLNDGDRRWVSAEAIGFAYRRTELPGDALVLAAVLRLTPGDPGEIRAAMEDARLWRRRTQPLAEPNCGSVFVNPDGDHAARLIEASGLKGTSIGGAEVSTKHANFIVARPGATSSDVLELIAQIQRRVEEASGIRLQTEVRVLGGGPDP